MANTQIPIILPKQKEIKKILIKKKELLPEQKEIKKILIKKKELLPEQKEIEKKDILPEQKEIKHKNKGIGAGGAITNKNGKKFEENTNNENKLIETGYKKHIINNTKNGYYLIKSFNDMDIVYVSQNGFKLYMKKFYNKNIFRCPDEAYILIFKDKIIIKILEKKEQAVNGSVELKLWASIALKREYEIVLGNKFTIEYGFCINSFLQNKIESNNPKYIILKQILTENNIDILYGDTLDYYNQIDIWIKKIE